MAADIVIGTATKRRKGPSHALRPLRLPKLLQTKTALFSFGGLRGLWSRYVGCVWMQLFMPVPMTSSAAVANFGGRRYRRFIPFNFLLSLAAPHLHGVLVLVTGDKFIGGDNDTGDHWKSVTRTKDKFFAGVVDTAEQLFAGVVDTGDKH